MYIVSSTPCLLFTFKAHGLSGQVFPLNDFFPFISWRQMLALSVVGLHSPLVGSVLIHNSMVCTTLVATLGTDDEFPFFIEFCIAIDEALRLLLGE